MKKKEPRTNEMIETSGKLVNGIAALKLEIEQTSSLLKICRDKKMKATLSKSLTTLNKDLGDLEDVHVYVIGEINKALKSAGLVETAPRKSSKKPPKKTSGKSTKKTIKKTVKDLKQKPGYTSTGDKTAAHNEYLKLCDDVGLKKNLIGKEFQIKGRNYWFAGFNLHKTNRLISAVCADTTKFGDHVNLYKKDLPIAFLASAKK